VQKSGASMMPRFSPRAISMLAITRGDASRQPPAISSFSPAVPDAAPLSILRHTPPLRCSIDTHQAAEPLAPPASPKAALRRDGGFAAA